MRRVAALVCAMLALTSPVRAADPPPASSTNTADFDALVKKGDQARIAGKWSDALKAYTAALEIRDDPLVAGHLGLVLMEFQVYDAAAGKLFQAIEQAAGANDAERMRFFQAFLVAKGQTCRLDVVIVQNGAKLEIDGEPRFKGRREGWTFVTPGKHKIKATLEGFEDETVDIDATKGGQLSIKIELHPVKPADELTKQPDPEPPTKAPESPAHENKLAAMVVEDKPPPPTNSAKKNGSFVVGLGGGFVFGATPTPAVGPNIFAAWRSRTWWEVGVDARVAWSIGHDELFPTTKFVTWSVQGVPCGRWKNRLLGCGLLELDGVQRPGSTNGRLLLGFGVRSGLEFETRPWLSFQVVGDVVFHAQDFEWQIPELPTSSRGSFVTGTVALRGLFKP